MTLRCYVVHAYSNFENRVKKALEERVKRSDLQQYFGRILVPTEEIIEVRSGHQRKGERKFFPGYVFVEMELTDETWHLIRSVPNVLGFIGGNAENPAPLSKIEWQKILDRVEASANKPKPKTLFEVGEVIRIIDGPFKDFNGTVEEVSYEKNKLRISVSIFGRSTSVELDFSQIEKS